MKKAKIILIAASAAMLLTGCMSREETEALSAWTVERYTAQAMAVQQRASWREEQDKPEIVELQIKELAGPSSALVPVSTPAQAEADQQEVLSEEAEPRESEQQEPLPVIEMASSKAAYEPSPTPAAKEESLPTPAEPTPIPKITCPPEPTPAPKIDWPYPAITCPPEPTPMPQPEWPGITPPADAPSTPDIPAPTEPDPTPPPTPEPAEPDPAPAPTPEPGPVETPPSIPEPTPTPAGGYAVCSCGATLTPDELIPHMKAHAMNGENHSYVAY